MVSEDMPMRNKSHGKASGRTRREKDREPCGQLGVPQNRGHGRINARRGGVPSKGQGKVSGHRRHRVNTRRRAMHNPSAHLEMLCQGQN